MPNLMRLVYPLRPTVKMGILLAVGVSVLLFLATPFLIPEISEHYGISYGAASLISTCQLGGFVIATWGAGRCLQPCEQVFVVTILATALANLLSALLPAFPLLLSLRFLSGCAQGLLTWYGWVQAFGDERRMGDVAVAGPMVSVIAAPLVSALINAGGAQMLFAALAVISLIPLTLKYQSQVRELPKLKRQGQTRPAALALLICLGIFTLGGSSVFVYSIVLGTGKPGMSLTLIAVGFSLNSLVGIPASRWSALRAVPSICMLTSSFCAFIICTTALKGMFFAALVAWGFFFWASLPGIFKVLASRSLYPEERVGDAQAVMAIGRTVGPLMGGLLIDGPGTTTLGIVATSLILVAATGVYATIKMTQPLHKG